MYPAAPPNSQYLSVSIADPLELCCILLLLVVTSVLGKVHMARDYQREQLLSYRGVSVNFEWGTEGRGGGNK